MYSPVKLWRNQKNVQALLGNKGVVVSFTIIRVPPEGHSNQAPYPIVVVELENKKRISVQMVDWEERNCCIGQRVRVVLRRVSEPSSEGVIPYGVKVKPM